MARHQSPPAPMCLSAVGQVCLPDPHRYRWVDLELVLNDGSKSVFSDFQRAIRGPTLSRWMPASRC
jgi:hypothetical protein